MSTGIPFPDISPEVFSISLFGIDLALRWYALAYIVGVIIAWMIVRAALKRPSLWRNGEVPMTLKQLEDLVTWAVVGVIIGGRLGYVLFYGLDHYLARPQDILILWQGGMSFHGGFAGVIVAVALFVRRNGLRLSAVADVVAIAAPPGLMLGRLANFVNAELWGRVTEMPWGVIFPGAAAQDCLSPVCARHPSQLYEAALEGLILGTVLLYLAFRRGWLQHAWRLTGVFLIGYGLARFLVEFVRQPDAQFVSPGNPLGLVWHVGGYGLTMGQILCLPMLAVGLWLVLQRRKA